MTDDVLPPARTAPGVAITAGSGYVTMLAADIQYLMTWPIQPPTELQAMSLAGTIVAICATLFHLWANKQAASPTPVPVNPPAPMVGPAGGTSA